jgi:DNA-binding beta-propeller fold protein YncE
MRVKLLIAIAAAVCILAGCSSSTSPEAAADVTAALEVTPTEGTAITDFTFDASGSTAGRALEFRWDWDSDGTWDTGWSADAVVEHRFTDHDTVTVTVQADEHGYRDTASTAIVLDGRHGYVLEELQMPVGALVLGRHGGSLWATNWADSPRLYEVDPATADTLRSIPAPSLWPCGICSDGTNLWVSDYSGGMRIFEIDPADGTVLSSFPATYSSFPGGLAWDGEHLYHPSWYSDRDGGDGLIHKYTSDGTEVGTIPCPAGSIEPEAIAYDGRDLWVAVSDVDTLYVIDKDDGDVLRTVAMDSYPRDIAVVGSYLWLLQGIHGWLRHVVP